MTTECIKPCKARQGDHCGIASWQAWLLACNHGTVVAKWCPWFGAILEEWEQMASNA